MNFLGTLQRKGCNLIVMSLMQGRRITKTKTERNLPLVFCWSISKIKYFGRINIAKLNHPTQGQFFCFFSRPGWNKVGLMNAFKCWAKSIIF